MPEPVKAAPSQWCRIGEEVSEPIDFEPARFLSRRLVRPKYVHRTEVDAVPLVAALPAMLQERCVAAPGFIAQILVAKYSDHLPLYRQESIYQSRHGVFVPRQNMARWVGLAAEWLKKDTCRWTKLRFGVGIPDEAKRGWDIYGRVCARTGTCFTAGRRVVRRSV